MKLLRISVLSLLLVFGVVTFLHAQNGAGFEQSSNWHKVSPDLQAVWKQAMKSGFKTQKVECFVVGNESLNDGDQSFLLQQGFAAQVVTGIVARGHMQIQALPNVASQPFVRQIKLADKP